MVELTEMEKEMELIAEDKEKKETSDEERRKMIIRMFKDLHGKDPTEKRIQEDIDFLARVKRRKAGFE